MSDDADVRFHERLLPRWPAWLVTGALVVMIAVAYGAALGALVGWALGVGLAVAATVGTLALAPVIEVTDAELRVGPARLPRTAIAAVTPLDAEAARAARGPMADARMYVVLRTLHAATAVRVELQDAADPHPAWLITTARPEQLAHALSSAGPTDGAATRHE